MCHVLLLLPVLALPLFWVLPLPLAGAAYAIVLLFSVWLYRAMARSMKRPVETGVERLRREVGEIVEVNGGKATVRLQNELWHCEGDALKPGDVVRVVGVDGLSLRVERSGSGDPLVAWQTVSASPEKVGDQASAKVKTSSGALMPRKA